MNIIIIGLLLNSFLSSALSSKPNVCKRFIDYYDMENNPNCWYDSDVDATLSEWVTNKGYAFEEYKVTSEDGYITGLYRIPRATPNKGVVYLLHPATSTMGIWIDKGANGSLGFMLHNAGYDVWLGNSRGSDYGLEHVSMTQNDVDYWDFSFHEMGAYDLPKQLEFVKNTTGSKVALIAHSMGSTVGYVYAALKPEHAKNHVHVLLLASPGGFFEKLKVPFLEPIARYVELGYTLMKMLNYVKIISRDEYVTKYSMQFCNSVPTGLNVCAHLSKLVLGINNVPIDPAFLPVAFTQYPGGVPMKSYVHFGQWIGFKHLLHRQFDYGTFKNRLVYNSDLPPKYPLEKIITPLVAVHFENDWISTAEGMEIFYDQLPDEAKIYGKIVIPVYNHADMLMATDCAEVVYKPLIAFIDNLHLSTLT